MGQRSGSPLLGSAVESILLYGSDAWTLTEKLTRQIDGCYTRLLRTALGMKWDQFLTNKELYGNLPKLSDKIRRRRLMLAGHSRRSENEMVSKLVLWTPWHGQRKQGRPALTYINTLTKDTGLETAELETCMKERDIWRSIVARSSR